MKTLILSIVIAFASLSVRAQMDIPSEGGNRRAFISEEVGITSISIKYSRPGVKGREGKIWGGLVANGFSTFNFVTNKPTSPWRAGANEATVISFEHDVKVEGKDLKAGAYALFMAMGTDTVTVIFSKQKEAWGSFYYREEDDVLRVKVRPLGLDKNVEWLKYEFIEHNDKNCVISMQWEKISVPFKVEVDVDNIVLARVREQLTSAKGFASGNLIHASRYFFEKNIFMEEALGWAQRAVSGKPFGQTSFDGYRTLAIGYEKLNRFEQADSVMNEGLIMANMNQHLAYGKTLIKQLRMDRAVDVLQAAFERYGDIYTVNNSLAYAYSGTGDYAKALDFAKKALIQAPNPQAKSMVSENIEKLKERKDIN